MIEYKQVNVVFKQKTTEIYQGIELLDFNLNSAEHQVQFIFGDSYSEERAETQLVAELTLPDVVKVSLRLQHQTLQFEIEILGSDKGKGVIMTDAFYWLNDSFIFQHGYNDDLSPIWINLVCQGTSFDEFGQMLIRVINTTNNQIKKQMKLMIAEQRLTSRALH